MNKLTTDEKKQIVNDYKKYFKRAYFNGYLYLDILKKSLNEYMECNKKSERIYRSINVKEWNFEYFGLKNRMKCYETIVITFAAMFLEYLIWDYARINEISKNKLEHLRNGKKFLWNAPQKLYQLR